jgi:hypothetical protein
MQEKLEFTTITGERSRTYTFGDGTVTVEKVTRLCVRPSGTHRLETVDGKKVIVAASWLSISVDADEWSA